MQGLRAIARRHFGQLVFNLKVHSAESPRAALCAHLLGCDGRPAAHPRKARLLLAWLALAVGQERMHLALTVEPCPLPLLDIARAATALAPAAGKQGADLAAALDKRLLRGHQQQPGPLRAHLDEVLQEVAGVWDTRRERNAEILRTKWAAADTGGDGVIGAQEFVAILRSTTAAITDSEGLRLYQLALDESARLHTVGEGLTADAVVAAADLAGLDCDGLDL